MCVCVCVHVSLSASGASTDHIYSKKRYVTSLKQLGTALDDDPRCRANVPNLGLYTTDPHVASLDIASERGTSHHIIQLA